MLPVPLAYKYVVMAAMMSQINYYAPRMHLPIDVPVKDQDIRFLHVSPPIVSGTFQYYGGRIQVKNYSFTFAPHGHLIYNLDEHNFKSFGVPMEAKESPNSGMERASKMKYVVNTNDAYRMATSWIAALEIDLAKLDAANPPRVEQGTFQSKRGPVPSPILSVEWKNPRLPGYDRTAFYVEITAVNGELRSLTDGDGTFSKRKQPLIKDINKLLAISDEVFLKYTEQERRNLVEQFTAVKDEQGSSTNIVAVIYDELFMSKIVTNSNAREKSDEILHEESRK